MCRLSKLGIPATLTLKMKRPVDRGHPPLADLAHNVVAAGEGLTQAVDDLPIQGDHRSEHEEPHPWSATGGGAARVQDSQHDEPAWDA